MNNMGSERQKFIDRLRRPNPESSAFFGDEDLLMRELRDMEKNGVKLPKTKRPVSKAPKIPSTQEAIQAALEEAFSK